MKTASLFNELMGKEEIQLGDLLANFEVMSMFTNKPTEESLEIINNNRKL